MGENVAGGLGFESFFHHSERWGLRFSVGESVFLDVVDFLRGGVCRWHVQACACVDYILVFLKARNCFAR